jgi:hypothetical protein
MALSKTTLWPHHRGIYSIPCDWEYKTERIGAMISFSNIRFVRLMLIFHVLSFEYKRTSRGSNMGATWNQSRLAGPRERWRIKNEEEGLNMNGNETQKSQRSQVAQVYNSSIFPCNYHIVYWHGRPLSFKNIVGHSARLIKGEEVMSQAKGGPTRCC